MSNAKLNDKNEALARDQEEAPDNNEGELNEQQLNDVAGGLRAYGPSDASARRNDDKSDASMARNYDKNDLAR